MKRSLPFASVLLALAIAVGALGTPSTAAADPLGEDAYAAWAADHAARLIGAMQLPGEFTLGDLRDTASRLGELVDEARAVEPPPRYAAAHAAYLAGVESVDQVRAALQTVVLTRQPVPGLADRLFDAGQLIATGLRQLRDAGVRMPAEIVALMDLGQDLGGQPSPGDVAAGAPTAPAAAPPAAGVAATGAQSTLLDVVGVLSQSSYTTGATSPSTSSLLVERLVFLPTRTRHRIAPNGSPHELDVPDPRHGNGHDSGPGPGARPPGRPGSRPTR